MWSGIEYMESQFILELQPDYECFINGLRKDHRQPTIKLIL
jgi:hypothetical protein